jgi:plastocyanin
MRNDVQMGKRAGGIILALLVGAVASFSGVATAGAADTITADLSCCTFGPGPYGGDMGEIPTFENPVGADAPHNVTSTATGPDGGPLFRSETIAAGSSSPVEGTQYLTGGTYPFYCTLHGFSMSGELLVSDDKGTVVPRPKIRVAIPSQSIASAVRSGTIRVKVTAVSGSPSVNLAAKLGYSSALGSASGVRLTSGTAKTVRIRLSRAGRRNLKRERKAVISVKGSVAFGSPVAAKRTIR